ncbi:hypothetical protein GCM10025858_06520 [Alicyclobacillus sacchari]|nr:hypothetical protein GCM10025858_06520 [Alicyclobacillus sacchari]
MPTVAFHTLGCKVNFYDTEGIWQVFKHRGYEQVPFEEKADVYVVNTCTVTHTGDKKSRQVIRRAVRTNPDAVVVVTAVTRRWRQMKWPGSRGSIWLLAMTRSPKLSITSSACKGNSIRTRVSATS